MFTHKSTDSAVKMHNCNLSWWNFSAAHFSFGCAFHTFISVFLLLLLFCFRYKCRIIPLVSIPARASSTACPSPCPTRCLILLSAHNPCPSPLSSQVSTCHAQIQYILLKVYIRWLNRDLQSMRMVHLTHLLVYTDFF